MEPGGLLDREPVITAVGPESFAAAMAEQGARVTRVGWEPPPVDAHLERLWRDDVDAANRGAIERLLAAHPVLVDVQPAIEVVPGMRRGLVLHAGPPIESTASMPVFVVENRTDGNRAYSTLNEGLGKVLRYGAFAAEVIERLRWFRDVLGLALGAAVRETGGVDARALIGQALQMGDECHNRNRAASALVIKALAPALAGQDLPAAERHRILAFAGGNEHFFLNLGMAACKAACDAAHGVPRSSLVTAMARNGTDFGIRVSGLGERWFTAAAGTPVGLYFSGFGAEHANPDIGDSAITETAGIGGFAMAGARRAPLHGADVRDHPRGEPGLPDPGARVSRHPHRDRRTPRDADRHPAPDQYRDRASRSGGRPDRRRSREAAPRLLRRRAPRPRLGAPG